MDYKEIVPCTECKGEGFLEEPVTHQLKICARCNGNGEEPDGEE